MEKTCTQCLCPKPLNEFYPHKQTKDGLRGSCKTCVNKRAVESYFKHKANHDRRSRDWKRNRIYETPYALLHQQLRSLQYLNRSKRAKIRNLPVTITATQLDELWDKQEGRCALSSVKMEFQRKSLWTVSIDRISSTKGYEDGNVQLVAKFINLGKNVHSNTDVLNILKDIREHGHTQR